MTQTVFPAAPAATLPVRGTDAVFPVHRIYCVGRNFADHAREMGASVDRGNPVFFCKPADALVPGGGAVPYPRGTRDLHHEVELVVALGRDARGVVPVDGAMALVFGYAVGLDLTRRDLQAIAKDKRLPWDVSKGFDASAPVSALRHVDDIGHPAASAALWLEVNGERRQFRNFKVPCVRHRNFRPLATTYYLLFMLNLVFMGTPAFAVPVLESLAARHKVSLVVTQPDKPKGRGQQLAAPPVKEAAQKLGIPSRSRPR